MRRYAAAIGILVGCAIGAAIGIPLGEPMLISTLSLAGLVIGYALSQQRGSERSDASLPSGVSGRLRELEKLRADKLITEEEYEAKRREILSRL